MKKRVRIYKAQTGMQMPGQVSDESIARAAAVLIADQGLEAKQAKAYLIKSGIDQNRVNLIVDGLVEKVKQDQEARIASQNNDQKTLERIDQTEQVDDYAAKKAQREAMYYDDLTQDDGAEEDQFMQDNIFRDGGIPSKRTFIKNFIKKAAEGTEVKADSTDDGSRKSMLDLFVKNLQYTADTAMIEKDAKAAYDLAKQTETPDPFSNPYIKAGGGAQRRLYKNINRALRNIPAGFAGPNSMMGMPNIYTLGSMGYPNMPQNPAMAGMYPAGIDRLEVEKSNWLGRPKKYSVYFNNQFGMLPQQGYPGGLTKYTDTVKDPARKVNELSLEEIDALINKDDQIAAEDAQTQANQEAAVAENEIRVSENTTPRRTTGTGTTTTTNTERTPAPWEEELQRRYEEQLQGVSNAEGYFASSPWAYKSFANTGFQNEPWNDELLRRYRERTTVPKTKKEKEQEIARAKATGNNLGAGDLEVGWRPYYMNANNSPWAYQTLPYQGKAPSTSKKKQAPTPTGKLNRYAEMINALNAPSAVYREDGGMVDSANPDLYKFILGGGDNGKLTDSPFFEDGGLIKAQKGYWKNGQWVEGVHPTDAAELNNNKTFDYSQLIQRKGEPKVGQTYDDWWTSDGSTPGFAPNKKVWDGSNWINNDGVYRTSQQSYNQRLPYNNPYIGNQYMGAPAYGAMPNIYPPLFGGRNRAIQYAGSWAQQRGLPIDMATGQPYTGGWSNPQLAKYSASGVRRSGMPRKFSMEYLVDEGPGFTFDPNATEESIKGQIPSAAEQTQGKRFTDRMIDTGIRPISWLGSRLQDFESKSDKTTNPEDPDNWGIDQLVEDTKRRQNAQMVAETKLPTRGIPEANVPEPQLERTAYVNAPSSISQSLPFRRPSMFQTGAEDAEIIPTQYNAPTSMYSRPEVADLAPGVAGPMGPDQAYDEQEAAMFQQQREQDLRGSGLGLLGLPTAQDEYMQQVGDQGAYDLQQAELQRMMEQNPDFYGQGVYQNEIPFGANPYSVINLNTRPAQQIPTNAPTPAIANTYKQPTRKSYKKVIAEKEQNKPVQEISKPKQRNTSSLERYDRDRYGYHPMTRQQQINFENQVDDWNKYIRSGLDIRDYLKQQNSRRQYGGTTMISQVGSTIDNQEESSVNSDFRFTPPALPDVEFDAIKEPMIEPTTDEIAFSDVESAKANARDLRDTWGITDDDNFNIEPGKQKRIKVDYKNKNMYNIDPQLMVQGANRFLGSAAYGIENLKDRKNLERFFRNMPYMGDTATNQNSRGTTNPNSGEMFQDDFIAESKYGGPMYAEGGETWMSEDDIRKFLEEGGELEFI
jgi:hypothetical protein